jgi:hypothetical protein
MRAGGKRVEGAVRTARIRVRPEVTAVCKGLARSTSDDSTCCNRVCSGDSTVTKYSRRRSGGTNRDPDAKMRVNRRWESSGGAGTGRDTQAGRGTAGSGGWDDHNRGALVGPKQAPH